MKLNDKIHTLLKEKGWKLKNLHRSILELFEDNSITYLTLLRTIHGQTKLRESTLFQIATALEKTPEDIRKDTDEEEKFIRYSYNKKAYLEIESSNLDFLTARLILLPQAKTETEQDPEEKGKFIKWIYGLQGVLTCVVATAEGQEIHHVAKNESFSFNSSHPHHFENTTNKKAVGLLIQNPKYI